MQQCNKCHNVLNKDPSFRTYRDMSTNREFTLCSPCIVDFYEFLGYTMEDDADPTGFVDASLWKEMTSEAYEQRIKDLELKLHEAKSFLERRRQQSLTYTLQQKATPPMYFGRRG